MNPKIRYTCLSTLIVCLFTGSGVMAQNELIGNWKVSCPIEKTSESSGQVCDLCPAEYSKETRDLKILNFEMQFEKKSVLLKTDTDLKTTFYTWDDSMRILEFKYHDRKYVFKIMVLANTNLLVMKEAEGALVIMERKL